MFAQFSGHGKRGSSFNRGKLNAGRIDEWSYVEIIGEWH
jgi:hypothetical protein